jgi:hypothetical protein
LDALQTIPPAQLDYNGWCQVGMALKEEGFGWEVWDDWSRKDSRYHNHECERKWNSFRGTGTPVTGGTIVQLAKDYGWIPSGGTGGVGQEIGWDDEISAKSDPPVVIDRNWLEGKELPKPMGTPAQQLITYLETLFDSSDLVGYVTSTWEKDGRYMPQKGSYDRTAGQLIEELSICDGDIGAVIGDCSPDAGAWIRFNPLDGQGVRNDNVTAFNFALVESDEMPIEEQYAAYRTMELPIACLVHSGGKSLHAIVRVDAPNYSEYQRRVDYLYAVCQKNGLRIDRQNRNPSRLSRMPGVMRNGHPQSLLATKLGKGSWEEWKEWIEAVNDDLPDTESLVHVWDNLPELSPPLIEGVLRQGHKLLLAGPSKAGKSFSLIELAICIAEGTSWLGFACAQGKVLYVNLELDRASCLHRFKDVYQAMGVEPNRLDNLHVWNLRGKSIPMDKLAPRLIRRAAKQNYLAVIIDPIYKVITGDENSADQMAAFCNQFDKVCTELGCAVIYCHHHSKGAQGGKRSMDRASGSGVFARDPDALLDMIELDITDDIRKQRKNNAICRLCGAYLERYGQSDKVGQDDLCSQRSALDACMDLLSTRVYNNLLEDVAKLEAREGAVTGWRIEGTLREFPRFPALNVWFEYPVHHVDRSGVLGDIQPEANLPWKKNLAKSGKRNKTPEERKQERTADIEQAFNICQSMVEGDAVSLTDLAEYLNKSEKTVRRYVKENSAFWIDGGNVGRK